MKNIATRSWLAAVAFVAACKGGGGGLSKSNVEDFRKELHAHTTKTADAVKQATDKLGAPTRAEGKKTVWAGRDGDSCFEFYIEDMDGNAADGMDRGAACPK